MPTLEYDEAWEARHAGGEPFMLKLRGIEVHLPAEMPAGAIIRIARLQGGDPTRELTKTELIGIASEVVPQPQMEQLTALGLSSAQMGDILTDILAHYMGVDHAVLKAHMEKVGSQGTGEAGRPSLGASSSGGAH